MQYTHNPYANVILIGTEAISGTGYVEWKRVVISASLENVYVLCHVTTYMYICSTSCKFLACRISMVEQAIVARYVTINMQVSAICMCVLEPCTHTQDFSSFTKSPKKNNQPDCAYHQSIQVTQLNTQTPNN